MLDKQEWLGIWQELIGRFLLKSEEASIYLDKYENPYTTQQINATPINVIAGMCCWLGRGFELSFDFDKQKLFDGRKIYVVLKTITNLDNIFLIGEITCNVIKVNEDANTEHNQKRDFLPLTQIFSIAIPLQYHYFSINKSLRKHAEDIKGGIGITENDTLCLTEKEISSGVLLQN